MSEISRNLVDPELSLMRDWPALTLTPEGLAVLRAGRSEATAALQPPMKDSTQRRVVSIPSADGEAEIDLVIFTPAGARSDRPAMFHAHGGGMIMGSIDMAWFSLAHPVDACDAVGISVEYRLAPESPFPASIEDCYSGLQWVVENAAELGIDTSRISVIGESAGAGLGAALALLARDRGGPNLAAQILIYPMLDHRTGTEAEVAPNPYAGEYIWTRTSNVFGWESLRGDYNPVDERAGHFSPALATDLSDLPPAFIYTGALDLFVAESMDYSRRLMEAGVPVELHVYPGAPHGFDVADVEVARQAKADRNRALNRLLA